MNKQETLILVLSLFVFVAVAYFVVDKIIDPTIERKQLESYDQGVEQGKLESAYTQTTQGILYYLNESGHRKSVALNDYCGGLVGQ